ncbi:hypothetical protein F5Y16DRAFT_357136 [Xylariaceae sp. FL0255]|nr:hypothetical protein F5Y16DRAFT_357136 [Xylariaceae sp. FL0255]
MPQFGATFYPGRGDDDYYMPEVIAPSPQRVMPEVPQNMQQGLQRMELEATEIHNNNNTRHHREPSLSTVVKNTQPNPTTNYSPASNFSPLSTRDMRDLPSFSPFPKVQGEHIPPSDAEKEAVLADSRHHVLHSNDPDMQICWARDVLSFVEIAAEAAQREADAQRHYNDRDLAPARPATPQLEHELRVDAINIVSYLADQDHPEALFIRSKWLEFGKFGRRQDRKEAYSGYVRAAQQGWGRADYRIGMLYENSNDMDKAMRHYQTGLTAKDSAAAYRLGMINLLGQRGIPKDIARGLDLIHQAADTADEDAPQGAFVYGMLIARDLPDVTIPDGVLSYDVTVARQYIEKAAYLGFAKAQLKMGQAYELCQLGCEFEPSKSLHYYGLAARQGQPEACLGVSRWFLFGYEGQFAKNEQLAFKYAQLAARTKLPTGEFAMGYYYEIGISVEKDLREARRWYELAAEHGNKDAVGRLEGLSQSKTLSKQDHETSTLGRIKSKHGSQRGQRPERFKQMGSAMPTLSETQSSPRVSPQPSPKASGFDSPAQPHYTPNNGRQTAFAVKLPDRSQSAAPYPEDDRPAPLSLNRPTSVAPYPEDDVAGHKPQLSPHFNPSIRPSAGPTADRPGSAFGIRPQAGTPVGNPRVSSASQLSIPPAGMDPNRARPVSAGWQPQVPGGYRQPSPGPRRQDSRPVSSSYDRPSPSGFPAQPSPGPNRLVKTGPGAGRGGPSSSGYGRESSVPTPHAPGPRASAGAPYDYHDGRASAGPGGPHRVNSATPVGLPQGGPGAGRGGAGVRPGPGTGTPLKDRPLAMDQNGRSSAPPAQARPSPAPSTPASTASAPAKPTKSGPATFEQMGIPQGKQDDDCIIM